MSGKQLKGSKRVSGEVSRKGTCLKKGFLQEYFSMSTGLRFTSRRALAIVRFVLIPGYGWNLLSIRFFSLIIVSKSSAASYNNCRSGFSSFFSRLLLSFSYMISLEAILLRKFFLRNTCRKLPSCSTCPLITYWNTGFWFDSFPWFVRDSRVIFFYEFSLYWSGPKFFVNGLT